MYCVVLTISVNNGPSFRKMGIACQEMHIVQRGVLQSCTAEAPSRGRQHGKKITLTGKGTRRCGKEELLRSGAARK